LLLIPRQRAIALPAAAISARQRNIASCAAGTITSHSGNQPIHWLRPRSAGRHNTARQPRTSQVCAMRTAIVGSCAPHAGNPLE
jgi:hypothetical protein